MSDTITCMICSAQTHLIQKHLKDAHEGEMTIEQYQQNWPDAPLLSEQAKRLRRELAAKKAAKETHSRLTHTDEVETEMAGTVSKLERSEGGLKTERVGISTVFAIEAPKKGGKETAITIVTDAGEHADLVPEVDEDYVFNVDLLKTVLMGYEINMPVYTYGHAGTGKSTLHEQICAYTGRPFFRIQHTANTEEHQIVGQWVVRDKAMVYELGPLALAMLHGWTYCADEYDFALPSIVATYQSVLEGKALIIKDAPHEYRVIKPHPMFRMVATGNTNGIGDETGLYQGTQIQNAANYERFGIVIEVQYMPNSQESAILQSKIRLKEEHADRMVEFATQVRKAYADQRIGGTISPRSLLNASKLALLKGGNWREGISLAFSNRLSKVDREVVNQLAQRIFG